MRRSPRKGNSKASAAQYPQPYQKSSPKKASAQVSSARAKPIRSGGGSNQGSVPVPSTPVENLHCARCHCTYDPTENTLTSCQIPHVFSTDKQLWRYIHEDNGAKDYFFDSRCCGEERKLLLVDAHIFESQRNLIPHYEYVHGHTMCFEGAHTPHEAEVGIPYNKWNVRKCKFAPTGKCARDWLNEKEMPVFERQYDRNLVWSDDESGSDDSHSSSSSWTDYQWYVGQGL